MIARPVPVVLSAAALVLSLGACGSEDTAADPPATSSTPAASTAPASPSATAAAGTTIAVTVRGNDLSPNAERVKVGLGEQVTLEIDADRSGEFHVHSTPEQEIAFDAGTTTATLSFDRPGLIEVEEHESDKLLVQFEVR